ncbi:glycosyltransferase family 10 domain-containing protein [Chthonobacter albigriseus]|uniref:glycosyltransferase family 10 domain-containing protein n=1 Tax=Chthonobacter albigriseus TaxID=1683161 RepID=UPI0015EFA42E|nr:glycosyltransferase family 10 [Chthonobacter albigriseus]
MELAEFRKPLIRIAFTDFPGQTNPGFITRLLSERYDVHVTDRDPDYVIYSVFGHEFLRFDNAIRIFFTGENVHPDFNLCDYAFSYDWLTFEDRHFRAPNFILYDQWTDLVRRGSSKVPHASAKTAFCNFIYSNGAGHPARDRFFELLTRHKPVESFGAHRKNSARTIGAAYDGDWSSPKVEAQRDFKFSIAFENSSSSGYTTEKIVHALAADTVPIYWGDPTIARVFNPDRFIHVDEANMDEAVERVIRLDADDDAYLRMVNQPFFLGGEAPHELTREALLDAFSAIFSRPLETAGRRNPYFWGAKYEQRRRREVKAGLLLDRLSRPALLGRGKAALKSLIGRSRI